MKANERRLCARSGRHCQEEGHSIGGESQDCSAPCGFRILMTMGRPFESKVKKHLCRLSPNSNNNKLQGHCPRRLHVCFHSSTTFAPLLDGTVIAELRSVRPDLPTIDKHEFRRQGSAHRAGTRSQPVAARTWLRKVQNAVAAAHANAY